MNHPIRAVIFDLDGTLVDTAPDLTIALNQLRTEEGLAPLSPSSIRPLISFGAKTIVKQSLDIDEKHPHFDALCERFIRYYENHLTHHTTFFPGIETVLNFLDEKSIPWSIVTNKLKRHVHPLLKSLQVEHRVACIVCGDSLATSKPSPEPILYACRHMQQAPSHCLYVGDSLTDVTASNAAGSHTIVALYGYLSAHDQPHEWQAEAYIQEPIEILRYL